MTDKDEMGDGQRRAQKLLPTGRCGLLGGGMCLAAEGPEVRKRVESTERGSTC